MTAAPKVLIIDDEGMIRTNMRAYFEDSGFQVSEAANGAEGIELCRRERPDLVFTDLRMPVLDGFGVIETLTGEFPETPVIVVSGAGTLGDAIRAVRLGAWDYITKPIQELDELEIVARSALERARLIAENNAYREHLEELVAQRTRALVESETRYRSLFETSSDGIILLRDGIICSANPAAEALFGVGASGLTGQLLSALAPTAQNDGVVSDAAFTLRLRSVLSGEAQQFDWLHQRATGELFAAEVSMNRLELDGAMYVQAIIHDITERKQYEERLYHQANFDALTGLPNRRLLTERLSTLLRETTSDDSMTAVMLLDIDKFKNINDILGHRAGDDLLRQMARRLAALCGGHDLLARFVGDEFVLVRTGCATLGEMSDLAHLLAARLSSPFTVDAMELFITVSIGIVAATDKEDTETAENLLKNAEAAMFKVKKEGVGLIQFFDREISTAVEVRLTMENRLRRAFDRNELSLHYQPQIHIASGKISGFEALLRWSPPGEEMVYPASFIEVLEESGLMLQVGEWVVQESCRQIREWLDQGLPPLRVSLNVTAWHIYSGRLAETVANALTAYGLDPSVLCLEVTETIVMHDIAEARKTLDRLHTMGVFLSIDDFGTGYSSLSYLTTLPINELKIDRSFIMKLPEDTGSSVIVTTILGMAETLHLDVVAEGVETIEQYQFLARHNCRSVQGFYFSRAMAPATVGPFIRAWRFPHPEQ